MYYDIQTVAESMMLEPSDIETILYDFFTEAKQLLLQSKKALFVSDFIQVQSFMHTLKGASLNFGMDELHHVIAHIELLAKEEQMTLIPAQLMVLYNMLSAYETATKKYYESL
jgi:hypothetical protein